LFELFLEIYRYEADKECIEPVLRFQVIRREQRKSDYKADLLLRYNLIAAKKDAATTNAITQVSKGQAASGSSPKQGKG